MMKKLIECWLEMMMNLIFFRLWINKDMNKKKDIIKIFLCRKIID